MAHSCHPRSSSREESLLLSLAPFDVELPCPTASPALYTRHRFPGEIISHAVWLYLRFLLSHRDVEELLFVRGVSVSYEAIRKWCRKYG